MRRAPGSWVLVSIAVGLTACSGTGGSASPDSAAAGDGTVPSVIEHIVASGDLPEEQRRYFEDGKVTLQEYQEAYGAFAQCAADAEVGPDLREQGRDEVTGLIEYSTRTLLSSPGQPSDGPELNECYHRWFALTEAAFQISDPTVLAEEPAAQMRFFDENLRPCLERIGVEVPDDLEFQDENWGPLNDEAMQALRDGRCGGA